MYSADGIDLTQTEFDELKFALAHPNGCSDAVRQRTRADTSLAPAYRSLFGHGLVDCQIAHGDVVIYCEPTRKAPDWLASYEKGVKKAKRLSRREWLMLAMSGIVSLVVAVTSSCITNAAIHERDASESTASAMEIESIPDTSTSETEPPSDR